MVISWVLSYHCGHQQLLFSVQGSELSADKNWVCPVVLTVVWLDLAWLTLTLAHHVVLESLAEKSSLLAVVVHMFVPHLDHCLLNSYRWRDRFIARLVWWIHRFLKVWFGSVSDAPVVQQLRRTFKYFKDYRQVRDIKVKYWERVFFFLSWKCG